MIANLIEFVRDDRGATAIEYGLIGGLVSIAIVTALTGAGQNLASIFDAIGAKVTAAFAE